jgi:hypothetical protein
MFVWYLPWMGRIYRDRYADRTAVKAQRMFRTGTAWLKSQHPDAEAVVASNNPWMVDYYTHLPAVVCPYFRDAKEVEDFVRYYHVRYIVLFGARNVGLREDRIRSASLPGRFIHLSGNVRIWDVPPGFWTDQRPTEPTGPVH